MPEAFELIGGHPALDLVNTLDWRFGTTEPLELLAGYDDLVRFTLESKLIGNQPRATRSAGARVLARVIDLREALAEIFYAHLDGRKPSTEARDRLERYFKEARLRQTLNWTGAPHLEWEWPAQANTAELPLWALAVSASNLMTSDAVGRVRACDSPECRWLFLDTSKNHTRRWCDMAVCGNRIKARRFKAKRKD